MEIEIEKNHIKKAQEIFIGNSEFDPERVQFIKNLDTCDLLAVPGSGKTTALMAKLYCIAQQMPFEDGSGILVLAHTNHAVEEIENKLKRHCPHLFEYPNFVGTIQSFVNKFIANTACLEKHGSYITKNDDDLIYKNILNSIKSKRSKAYWKINFTIEKDKEKSDKNFIEIIKTIKYNEANNCFDSKFFKPSLKFTTDSGKELKEIFEEYKHNGNLLFFDSFELGNWYLKKYPRMNSILQQRFKYVFIDEMQDLENFQIEIIDSIFFGMDSKTIIQRIGDKNQSIYNSVRENCDWKTRQEIDPNKYQDLSLKKSLRLTEKIGDLVDCFVLERPLNYSVNGALDLKEENIIPLEKLKDGCINPHLILFDKNTTGSQLKTLFIKLIDHFNLLKTKDAEKKGFKIIGWSTEWKEEERNEKDKIRLKDLFSEYSKESKQKKEDFDCLKKYLQLFDQEKQTLEAVRKSILNAFIRILRYEEIKIEKSVRGISKEKFYSKSDLITFIKDLGNDFYSDFKSKLFSWCFNLIINKDYEKVYVDIKKYIENDFIKYNWNKTDSHTYLTKNINKSKEFIESEKFEFKNITIPIKKEDSDSKNEKINIEISSVHAVKGQTHCATMYVETAYNRPIYETLKLIKKDKKQKISPLFFENHKCNGTYDKQALKMMYVGFSRPTHLLCFAVLEENVKDDIQKFKNTGWEIVSDLIKI